MVKKDLVLLWGHSWGEVLHAALQPEPGQVCSSLAAVPAAVMRRTPVLLCGNGGLEVMHRAVVMAFKLCIRGRHLRKDKTAEQKLLFDFCFWL